MRILVLAPLLLLAGCAPTLERNAPEPRIYRLAPPSLEAGAPLAADLLVLRPVVANGLRGERIASLWPGNRLDYFAGARWSGDLGDVVQTATVEALSAAGALRNVEAEPGRFGATHVLGLELRRFEADYVGGTPPLSRVTIVATVGRQDSRKALATWTASAEVPAAGNTITAVTAALDEAFGRVLAELLQHSQEALAADLAGQPGAPAAR
jgi:cholesterol transport system auxiliary component